MMVSKPGKQTVSIVTTSRADFGIYRSVLKELTRSDDLDVGLIVTGMHLAPEFGYTFKDVVESGFAIRDSFDGLVSSDSEEGIAKSMGLTVLGAAQSFTRQRPDLLVVLGDRFEMHAVALAALPFRIPVAHIHGGEETEGAIDNSLRHSITKLSHLHFCATEHAAQRVRAMGEKPEQIVVSGAPALDGLKDIQLLERHSLEQKFGIPANQDFVLVTYHPETLDPDASLRTLDLIANVVRENEQKIVFTSANADTSGRKLNERIRSLVDAHSDQFMLVEHMGTQGYFSAMNAASLMIGNSSSGIIEAASFGLPVLNIGNRQSGRERSPNVIDVDANESAIRSGIATATSKQHREICARSENVYGDGNAGSRIAAAILEFLKGEPQLSKRFVLRDAN